MHGLLIADNSAALGYLRSPGGAVLALDLTHGNVLWRTKAAAWPLLALPDKLIGARSPVPHALAIVVLEASSGREVRISKPLLLPEWVEVSPTNESVFSLRAWGEDDIVEVHWHAHARYRGGAAPNARVLEAGKRDAQGAFQFDLASGEIAVIPAAAGRGARLAEAPAASPAVAAESDVIEQHDIGSRCFQLVAPAGETSELLVRAVDVRSGQTLWETAVGEVSSRRPRPPRP
ncbi:MAG: hypothetical protein H0V78_03375 [Burkholderiales bacterium]|nr:hypothetical protein [Burkholderiales bacterium]